MTFSVEESANRISAIGLDGAEICGAFQPHGHQYWQLFVNRRTGLRLHPGTRFAGTGARDASRAWVCVVAETVPGYLVRMLLAAAHSQLDHIHPNTERGNRE
ncbi:hypothetical protein [Mycolicibacterium palauense]|uniref:hypothetical protein n=1 Tax=Mycolicibacterium palauense TaxID=2034511 RepID=UPI0011455D8D|nr:hypothetical protein [Mycolicibacterium palauense]